MPYLIQRKSDGMFLKNKDYHSYGCGFRSPEEHNFTKNKSECKPFKSLSGAKHSRVWDYYVRNWVPFEPDNPEHNNEEKNRIYGLTGMMDGQKQFFIMRKKTEEELEYRIVEVKVIIK
jgi:hypothetical protein